MTSFSKRDIIENNLSIILVELENQIDISSSELNERGSIASICSQIREWIFDAKEYGIAYESIVCLIEQTNFILTGKAAIKLLELGLIFGFKTDRPEDISFNIRK